MSESVPAITRTRWLRLSAAVGAMMLTSIYQWFEERQRFGNRDYRPVQMLGARQWYLKPVSWPPYFSSPGS